MAKKAIAQFGAKYSARSDWDEPINLALREHIDANEDWEHQAYVEDLHQLYAEINDDFFENKLPTPTIGVKTMQKNRIGKYSNARNEFALAHELLFNGANLPTSDRDSKASGNVPFWYVAMEMLHVLMHMGENLIFEAPKSRVHTTQFMDTTKGWGITTNKKACQVDEVVEGTFTKWLEMKGIDFSLPYVNNLKQERTPKLKWSCECEEFSIKVDEGKDASVLKCSLCDVSFSRKELTVDEKAAKKEEQIKAYTKRKKGAKKPKPKGKTNSKPKVDVSDIDVDIGIPASELPSAKEIRGMSTTQLRGLASQFNFKAKGKEKLVAFLIEKVMEDADAAPTPKKAKKGKAVPKTVAKSATKRKPKATLPPELIGHFEIIVGGEKKDNFQCLHCPMERKSKGGAKAHLKADHPKIKPIAA